MGDRPRPLAIRDEMATVLTRKAGFVFWKSNFKFLQEHNGLRPSNLHLILGSTHIGKSTLVRSILADLARYNSDYTRCLVWLSEESVKDFTLEFSCIGIPKELIENIRVISEQDIGLSERETAQIFQAEASKSSIVIFDNITTSCFYMDKKVEVQSSVATFLKHLVNKVNIPIILVAHTRTGISEGHSFLIEPEDIRGCRSIVNLIEFCYVLQAVRADDKFYPFLRICKNRGQEVSSRLFLLKYNLESRIYSHDKAVSFDFFKDIFKERNKL